MRPPISRPRALLLALPLALPLVWAAGCRPDPATATCPEPATVAAAAAEDSTTPASDDAVDPLPRLQIRITPTLALAPAVAVHLALFPGADDSGSGADPTLQRWHLPGPIAGPITVAAEDAQGPLASTVTLGDDGLRVQLERAPTLPLRLDYVLAPSPIAGASLPRLSLDEAHFFATGEALLLLPDEALERRLTIDLEIDPATFVPAPDPNADPSADPLAPTGLPPLRAASSFAAAPAVTVEGWPFELRRAAFVAGPLEWAELDSMHGDDRWLGVGPTRFDQRWSAAELAGVRSTVDGAVGMPTLEPLVTILVAGATAPTEPEFVAELRGRGLVIHADQHAAWSSEARMRVTQALVGRWLGGRVRVLEAPDLEHGWARELWFTGGATRFVARELLYGLGLFDDQDNAAEIDWIELELATSPLRDRSATELAALADSDDPRAGQARAQLMARGAIFMAALDDQLRHRPQDWARDGVVEALRTLVARAIATERRDYAVADVLGLIATWLSHEQPPKAELDAAFEAVVGRGERPALGTDAYGPCFVPRPRSLRPFDLGFVDTTGVGDEQPSFALLDPKGPAAKAGLREDDRLLTLDYLPGDPEQTVQLTVARGDDTVTLRYRPAGPARRVIQWHRDPRVSAEACVR